MIEAQPPPQARVDNLEILETLIDPAEKHFLIRDSVEEPLSTYIPHDLAICESCIQDFFSVGHPHYGDYFVSCTDCGPRYTIIQNLPYDRERTAMNMFPFCESCQREFFFPDDRRFNAQATTCPICGPHYEVLSRNGVAVAQVSDALLSSMTDADVIEEASRAILAGQVVALKGIGGYHLLCDPENEAAVSSLMSNKRREGKPMALVAASCDAVERICHVSSDERRLFESGRSPIVLFYLKYPVWPAINDGLKSMGIMRAYTAAFHDLLKRTRLDFLVATSANLSGVPTIISDKQATEQLADCAKLVIGHNRPIVTRCDDSLIAWEGAPLLLRSGRGYAPTFFSLGNMNMNILACGAQEKAAFAMAVRGYAACSQYMGDQDTLENRHFYQETLEHFFRLFQFCPQRILYDMHPDYATSRLGVKYGSKVWH